MRHRGLNSLENLKRQQRSIWYASDHDRATEDHLRRRQQHYLWMFTEDLSLNVIPSSLDRDEYEARLVLEPPSAATEKLLARAFSVSDNTSYRLGYSLSEFVRLLVSELCSYDRVTYEIVYLYEPEKDMPAGFELVHLNPTQLRRRWGRIVQMVPSEIARERKVSTEIELQKENLVTFKLPSDLRRVLARTIANLDVLSDRQWHALGIAAAENRIPYDFSTHHRSMMLALAEATRAIGWNGRATLYEHTLTTFWLRREVGFQRFVASVRSAIMKQVNALLRRVGPKVNFDAQLRLEGFPTDAALDEILTLIDTGGVPLNEIVDRLSRARRKKE